jgi:O-antigen/teichoic acid export membrane protein
MRAVVGRAPSGGDVQRRRTGTAQEATRRQLRGSTLLAVGRIFSVAANFAAQVLIVRFLSKSDFGAFAYALAIASLLETTAALGLDRAVSRFLPIYHEREESAKAAGTVALAVATILTVGLGGLLVVYGLQALAGSSFLEGEAQAASLVLVLVLLGPIRALDAISIAIFAVFSRTRAIFVRKHVLGPVLRLAIVLALVASGSGVIFLAAGFVVAGAAVLAIYLPLLVRLLREEAVLAWLRPRRIDIPARELFGFALPLLSIDALYVVMNSADALLLAHFGTAEDVASFKAIQPAARLNQTMLATFALLFTPVAARLFARGDTDGVRQLYWRTATWVALFSFPLFVLTFSLAEPVTVGLFGERYRSSATFLALLSLAYYFNAALGFNGLMLRVYGLVRYVVVISLAAAVVNVALNLVLIPLYGALGAAIGTAATLVAHNVLKQAGLRRGTGVSIFERRYLRFYLGVTTTAVVVLAVQLAFELGLALSIGIAVLASAALVLANRGVLEVRDTFPELARLPLVGRLAR